MKVGVVLIKLAAVIMIVAGFIGNVYAEDFTEYMSKLDIENVKNMSLMYQRLEEKEQQKIDGLVKAILEFDKSYSVGESLTESENCEITDLEMFIKCELPELLHVKNVNRVVEGAECDYVRYDIEYYTKEEQDQIAKKVTDLMNVIESMTLYGSESSNEFTIIHNVRGSINYERYLFDILDWAKSGGGNCQVYAKVYTIALRRNGIPASYVTAVIANNGEGHMWTLIGDYGGIQHSDATTGEYIIRHDSIKENVSLFHSEGYELIEDELGKEFNRWEKTNIAEGL